MTEFKSTRDKTIGEIFDEMCKRYDETGRNERIANLFKGRHPVTNEIIGLKIELMEV